MQEKAFILIIVLLLFAAIDVMGALARSVSQNPFSYPYFDQNFDVTGKKNMDLEEYVDGFLLDDCAWQSILWHQENVGRWKREKEQYLETCRFRSTRRKQYRSVLDDDNAYRFTAFRRQTRYKQVNYQRYPYYVNVVDQQICCSFQTLSDRRSLLLGARMQANMRREEKRRQRHSEFRSAADNGNGIWITTEEFRRVWQSPGDRKDWNITGCYVLYNCNTNQCYVGQAKNIPRRVHQHLTGNGDPDVYADLRKGARFKIKMIPMRGTAYNSLDEMEKQLIAKYNAYYDGYNKTRGNG
jgi:hypothetical protein